EVEQGPDGSTFRPSDTSAVVDESNLPVPWQVDQAGLTPLTSYYLRVRLKRDFSVQATNWVRYGNFLNAVPVTTPGGPVGVLGIEARDVGARSAELVARINPRGARASYRIEWGTDPGNLNRRAPDVDALLDGTTAA